MGDPLGERLRGQLEALPDNRWLDIGWALSLALAFALNAAGLNDGVWFWVVLATLALAAACLVVQLLGRASRAAARGELI